MLPSDSQPCQKVDPSAHVAQTDAVEQEEDQRKKPDAHGLNTCFGQVNHQFVFLITTPGDK